jgi:hypothetical protein
MASLVSHNLPFANQRCPVFPEINLISHAVRVFVVYRLDDGIDDSTAMHGDADVVANFRIWVGPWPLRPFLDVMPLRRDSGYVRCPLAIATRYAKAFDIDGFEILFAANV